MGASANDWTDDPWPQICSANVIVTHAGQGAVADVAAAQRPAVIIPQPRPFDEQLATARVLRQYRLAVVTRRWLDRSTLRPAGSGMRTAVITTVHGRGNHPRRQIAGLQLSTQPPDLHVVVALGDPTVREVVASATSSADVIDCRSAGGPLPVAQGRNAGAAAALHRGAELLVFLDVDCIPAAALIDRYHHAAAGREHAAALLCGPVT